MSWEQQMGDLAGEMGKRELEERGLTLGGVPRGAATRRARDVAAWAKEVAAVCRAQQEVAQFSREGVEEFLEEVRIHMHWLEDASREVSESYEQSCCEQITTRQVVKKDYFKFEVTLRPGKPQPGLLSVAAELAGRLEELRAFMRQRVARP